MSETPHEKFADLLSDPEGNKLFSQAVQAVIQRHFGAVGVAYDVDRLGILAAGIESQQYAERHMQSVPRFADRIAQLTYAAECVSIPGSAFEFGVHSGTTINHIAHLLPTRRVFGFDSFEGLPEAWSGMQKGHFSTGKVLPNVASNVELVVGWFDRTLPAFLDTRDVEPIALIHVDCDLYSSTQTVLSYLAPWIVSGTIIVFDEYFNYAGWQKHEYLAFQEFITSRSMEYEYIGISPRFQHVSVRIK